MYVPLAEPGAPSSCPFVCSPARHAGPIVLNFAEDFLFKLIN